MPKDFGRGPQRRLRSRIESSTLEEPEGPKLIQRRTPHWTLVSKSVGFHKNSIGNFSMGRPEDIHVMPLGPGF
jgi:hypothetical protein